MSFTDDIHATGGSGDSDRSELLDALKRKIQHCESLHHEGDAQTVAVSSGCDALDAMLPRGGFRPDGLVEWVSDQVGSGVGLWALHVAGLALALQDSGATGVGGRASGSGQKSSSKNSNANSNAKAIVVIDHDRTFYPPAAASIGIDLQRLVIVQPRSASDTVWAVDQALRCPAVAAVWANLTNLPRLDPRDFRRFQLAAEEGCTLGLLLRPLTARGKPSWSDVQLQVASQVVVPETSDIVSEAVPAYVAGCKPESQSSPSYSDSEHRWLHVQLLRCRGGRSGGSLHVEMASSAGRSRNIRLRAVDLSSCMARVGSMACDGIRKNKHLEDRKESSNHSKDRFPPTFSSDEASHHETSAVYLASQLARPAAARRSARA